MQPIDLIRQKRDGHALSPAQMKAFIRGVSDDSWPDYQLAAMLMAMYLRGLDEKETTELTLAMAASGHQLDLSQLAGMTVDKHSTGGVADTTTLVLMPLIASCGLPMLKMSGRGLGFTGGTIDKLESIPGFRTDLGETQALRQVDSCGMAILSQTQELTPADRKLYALRDVTATVESIPLIAASIMSKKLAAGAKAILLDVKCGSGAFMRDEESAKKLAQCMVTIGQNAGRRTRAVISRMDQPLGDHVGNALEVIEAIEILRGKRGDLCDLSIELGAQILNLTERENDLDQARKTLRGKIDDGQALAKMRTLFKHQGADPAIVDDVDRFPKAACHSVLKSPKSGRMARMDTAAIGQAFILAGGGRLAKDDAIDYSAGFILHKRLGDEVKKGDTLFDVFCQKPEQLTAIKTQLLRALDIKAKAAPRQGLIIDVIDR